MVIYFGFNLKYLSFYYGITKVELIGIIAVILLYRQSLIAGLPDLTLASQPSAIWQEVAPPSLCHLPAQSAFHYCFVIFLCLLVRCRIHPSAWTCIIINLILLTRSQPIIILNFFIILHYVDWNCSINSDHAFVSALFLQPCFLRSDQSLTFAWLVSQVKAL